MVVQSRQWLFSLVNGCSTADEHPPLDIDLPVVPHSSLSSAG
jgi:hypothetical protein